MAADWERETEALEWLQCASKDMSNEARSDEAGEVWWVQFDPSVGSRDSKNRPAVVMSNDAANRNSRQSRRRTAD